MAQGAPKRLQTSVCQAHNLLIKVTVAGESWWRTGMYFPSSGIVIADISLRFHRARKRAVTSPWLSKMKHPPRDLQQSLLINNAVTLCN